MRIGRGLWAALLLFVLVLCPLSAEAIGEVTGRLGGVVTIDGTKMCIRDRFLLLAALQWLLLAGDGVSRLVS